MLNRISPGSRHIRPERKGESAALNSWQCFSLRFYFSRSRVQLTLTIKKGEIGDDTGFICNFDGDKRSAFGWMFQ